MAGNLAVDEGVFARRQILETRHPLEGMASFEIFRLPISIPSLSRLEISSLIKQRPLS
jgi:hypothetical protein